MALAYITLALLAITIVSFLVGTVWLSKYAFRLGAGPGIGVLLFPPYTFYFAFYKLEQETKDRPTALWMFGLVASILIALIFSEPLGAAARGDMSALAAPVEQQQKKKVILDDAPAPEKKEEAPATTPAVADQPDAGTAATPDAGAAAAPAAAEGTEAKPAEGAEAKPAEGTEEKPAEGAATP